MLGQLNTERRAWLAELYELNLGPIFKTCASVLRNADDAADASQEVFLIAADSMQPGTSQATARAWLQTVARNHCVDLLRRRTRLGKLLVILGGDSDELDDVATAVADRDLVGTIFKRLSPIERQALWHSAVEHRPVDEIAGRLQLSYMAAAQVISRARRHALQLAARVAVVLGLIRLNRNASRLSLTSARLAALPVIALSGIGLQTSGSPAMAVGTGLPSVARPAIHRIIPSQQTGGVASTSSSARSVTGVSIGLTAVPSAPSSTINLTLNAVHDSFDRVAGRQISPLLPEPSLEPVPRLPINP